MKFSKRQRTKFLIRKYACSLKGMREEMAYRLRMSIESLIRSTAGLKSE